MSSRNKAFLLLTAALFALGGFTFGFVACLHLKSTSPIAERKQELDPSGNAPPAVRVAIVEKLQTLQDGYTRRDPKILSLLTQNLFPKDGDVLILGTDGGVGEWVRGAPAARDFIAGDWRYWGRLQLDTDHAIVWSSGNAAWMATIGTVRWEKRERPIRFTAILTHEQDRWVFRQMHFQWDDDDPSTADLFRTSTYARLLSDALQ